VQMASASWRRVGAAALIKGATAGELGAWRGQANGRVALRPVAGSWRSGNQHVKFASSQANGSGKDSAQEASKEAGAKDEKEDDQTVGAFFQGLKKEFKLDSKDTGAPKVSLKEKLQQTKEKVVSSVPVIEDERSWSDALRAVFGIKPEKKKSNKPAATPEEGSDKVDPNTWYEAKDKDSGELYYYNLAGDTVWEKPEGKILKPEDAPLEEPAATEPSYYEKKITEKAAEITELEAERDAALAESDTAKFKEVNKKVRELRKEIQRLGELANTTAVVHVEEKRDAWDKFNDRLKEAPIIRSILGLADSDVARKVRDSAEDAREALETSQNPLVYRMFSAYDSVFAETEEGEAVRAFRKMEPDFLVQTALEEIEDDLAPTVIKAFLRGDMATIDGYCSEGAGAAVKQSIRDRLAAGRKSNETILSISDINLMTAKVVDKVGPIMVVSFMCQQINCLYDNKGNVVEGSEDEIVGVFYVFGLTREYDEVDTEYKWKIKEFAIGGVTPYL